jgi:hypothetical protein
MVKCFLKYLFIPTQNLTDLLILDKTKLKNLLLDIMCSIELSRSILIQFL